MKEDTDNNPEFEVYEYRHGQQTSMQVVMWLPKIFLVMCAISFVINSIDELLSIQ